MFVVMKDGKYFTGEVVHSPSMESLLWTRHPAEAKVWKKQRRWAQKAAQQWDGTVVERATVSVCEKVQGAFMLNKQYMLASYQVKLDDLKAFLEELIATEQAYREESLITESPIIRMTSKKNPEFILKIIEFIDSQAVTDLMSNDNVQAHWGKLADMWKKGGFAADEIPEAHIPWALMDAIHS